MLPIMFNEGDIAKVLIPNEVNNGFDYRLTCSADIGDLVGVTVRNKNFIGIIIDVGDGDIKAEKIKPIVAHYGKRLAKTTVAWMKKMSEWTMMPLGNIWKQMASAANFKSMHFSQPCPPKSLANAGYAIHNYFDTEKVVLNDGQRAVADSILLNGFNVHLLDGITGSGKTQVYFDAVWKAYSSAQGQILIMMPEIALTTQFIARFKDRFGYPPTVWHSGLTPAKRRKIWHGVLNGDVRIVVGTRSALFLPWQSLRLVVIDEEHDTSYKQEEMGNYHARDMAILLAKISDFPIILASATPSFETVKNVMSGKYRESKLTTRFGGAILPRIEIVDMRKK